METDEQVTIKVDGELAIETVEEFEAATARWTGSGKQIELDCRCLAFIDSTGVSGLIKAVVRWQASGAQVAVNNLSDDLKEMLGILGFYEAISDQG